MPSLHTLVAAAVATIAVCEATTVNRNTYWTKFYEKYAMAEPGPASKPAPPAVSGSLGFYNILFDMQGLSDPEQGKGCNWESGASPGPHSQCGYPQYLSVDAGINAMHKFGVPKEKIIMGAAHYGRAFNQVETTTPDEGEYYDAGYNRVFGKMCSFDYWDCFRDETGARMNQTELDASEDAYCLTWSDNTSMEPLPCKQKGWMSDYGIDDEPRFVAYKDIVRIQNEFPNEWAYTFDKSALAPILWNEEKKIYITYDDPRSIEAKADYVNMEGLAGLMYWQMGQDTEDWAMTGTMDRVLEDGKVRLGYYLLEGEGGIQGPADGRGVDPEDIPWDKLTRVHLSFFNIEGNDDNQGDAPYECKVPRSIRNDAEVYENWVEKVMRMFRARDLAFDNGEGWTEIAIAIGGWAFGNRNAPDAYAYREGIKPAHRQALVDSSIDIMELGWVIRDFPEYADEIRAKDWHFDVYDMDWEYPGQETNDKIWDAELGAPISCMETEAGFMGDLSGCKWGDNVVREDVTNLADFLQALRAQDNGRNYARTIASAGAIYSLSFIVQDLPYLAAQLENINAMTYDYSGPWLARPPTTPGSGYGNVECGFQLGGSTWTWWLCSTSGFAAGPTTAHHTNLYPSVLGLNVDDINEQIEDEVPLYGAWSTSQWNADPCQLDAYGSIYFQSEQQCRDHYNSPNPPTNSPPAPTGSPPGGSPTNAPPAPTPGTPPSGGCTPTEYGSQFPGVDDAWCDGNCAINNSICGGGPTDFCVCSR